MKFIFLALVLVLVASTVSHADDQCANAFIEQTAANAILSYLNLPNVKTISNIRTASMRQLHPQGDGGFVVAYSYDSIRQESPEVKPENLHFLGMADFDSSCSLIRIADSGVTEHSDVGVAPSAIESGSSPKSAPTVTLEHPRKSGAHGSQTPAK